MSYMSEVDYVLRLKVAILHYSGCIMCRVCTLKSSVGQL